jgi:hypothetical protein
MKNNEMMKLRSIKFFHHRESTHFVSSSSMEIELYERYSPRHSSCHHLRSEQVEVEGMNMPKVEGIDMIEEQDHPTNHHRLEEECMNMVGSNMVEVDGMDIVEEHFNPINHISEVECMNTVKEHFHPMNHRSEVEGMNTIDTGMREDRAAELKVVEGEPEGMVLVRHWTDGAARHHQTRRKWEELTKPGCSKDQSTFATQGFSCSSS